MSASLEKPAYNVKEFLAAYGIGRTTFYSEGNAGRLTTVHCRGRTLIRKADADAWLNGLPAEPPRRR